MRHVTFRSVCLIACAILFVGTIAVPYARASQQQEQPVLGFYVKKMPHAYPAQERFLASLKSSGVQMLLLELPIAPSGDPDLDGLQKAVFLSHANGLKLLLVMPTRRDPAALAQHPDWEDRRYDSASRRIMDASRLDLFRKEVVDHLASRAKLVASYAVDGILLADDFLLDVGEGWGTSSMRSIDAVLGFERDFAMLAPPAAAGTGGRAAHSEQFRKWAGLKRDRLVGAYRSIKDAARTANPAITVGIPVPVIVPMGSAEDLLARHSFDAAAFREAGVDRFWTVIAHQDIKDDRRLSFSETLTVLSRSAQAAVTAVKDPSNMIIVLQAVTASGRPLPLAEIEETTDLVRRAGRTGIAYIITPTSIPPSTLMRKLQRGGGQ